MLTQVFEMTDKSACKYWDCGWCYAPNYLKTNAINSTCVNPYECPISPLSEPVQYETPMTEIEELKAQIKVLEAKLSLLEEIEKHKSPAEEAYKRVYGNYPTGEYSWIVFKKGYKSAQEDYKVGEYQPTPQEPEQVADGLKEAFREAVKQGVVSSSTKPQTLTDLIADWWADVFTTGSDWDGEICIDNLVEQIKHWLPKEQSASGSQNAYVECSVEGYNDCINKIRRKLR
jgi:hypothetical protein